MWALGVASLVLSLAAVAVAALARRDSSRSAAAAERSVEYAAAADRRSREPRLQLSVPEPAPEGQGVVIIQLRNHGPQDLTGVWVHPAHADDGRHDIAVVGQNWSKQPVVAGPLLMGDTVDLHLSLGALDPLPPYLFKIDCSAGDDRWTILRTLAGEEMRQRAAQIY